MPTSHPFELEVCVDQVSDALAAAAAGATRIEMNCALELDGLTPPQASCRWLKQNCSIPILAMLRPHHRSFTYSDAEEIGILRDCQALLEAGVDGIVFGSLNDAGQIALPILRKVMALCGGREVVFHRAFDQLEDQFRGLEELVECGVRRILTSGGARTAAEGTRQLQALVRKAEERIEILPGGGINSLNAEQVLQETHCNQLHGSFRTHQKPMQGPDSNEIRKTLEIIKNTLNRP